MIMEVAKAQELQLASWGPRRAGDVALVWVPKAWELGELMV